MSNGKIISYGALVERSLDGVAFTKIVESKGVAVPAPEQDYADVTSLDSPGGNKEYMKGLRDIGTIDVPCNYTSEGYAQQLSDQAEDEAIYYRVTLKPATGQVGGDVFVFRGFPTPKVKDNGLGEAIGMDISIRATGAVTFTAGATS